MKKFMLIVNLFAVMCGVMPIMGMEDKGKITAVKKSSENSLRMTQVEVALAFFTEQSSAFDQHQLIKAEGEALGNMIKEGCTALRAAEKLGAMYNRKIQALKEERKTELKRVCDLSADVNELERINRGLESEKVCLKSEANNVLSHSINEKKELQQRNAQLTEKVQELQKRDSVREFEALERQNFHLNGINETLNKKLEEQAQTIGRINFIESTYNQLKDENRRLEMKTHQNYDSLERSYNELGAEYKKKDQQLNDLTESHRSRGKGLVITSTLLLLVSLYCIFQKIVPISAC